MPTLTEAILETPIPRAEVPGWREKYGVVAGITRKPYDLGLWNTNPVGDVSTRWREFRRAELGFSTYVLGNQVHGTRVVSHGSWVMGQEREPTTHDPRPTTFLQIEGVDGHETTIPGTMLCVTVADCTPVYLLAVDGASERPLSVALLHAGWRGTAAGILKKGVELLRASANASASASVVAHLGVSICGGCYEVGPEVFDAMNVPRPATRDQKGHFDVRRVLEAQAKGLGIEEVTVSGHCSRHGEGWYSHRGGDAGRMVGYLGALTP